MAKDYNPDEMDRKCKELCDLFVKNIKEIAKAIDDNHTEWLVELSTNDSLRFMAFLFVKTLSIDLDRVEQVRTELSDWL